MAHIEQDHQGLIYAKRWSNQPAAHSLRRGWQRWLSRGGPGRLEKEENRKQYHPPGGEMTEGRFHVHHL
jgi:hypothetical protein